MVDGVNLERLVLKPADQTTHVANENATLMRMSADGKATFDWPGIEREAEREDGNTMVRAMCRLAIAAREVGRSDQRLIELHPVPPDTWSGFPQDVEGIPAYVDAERIAGVLWPKPARPCRLFLQVLP